jgi:hypothetical protein
MILPEFGTGDDLACGFTSLFDFDLANSPDRHLAERRVTPPVQ